MLFYALCTKVPFFVVYRLICCILGTICCRFAIFHTIRPFFRLFLTIRFLLLASPGFLCCVHLSALTLGSQFLQLFGRKQAQLGRQQRCRPPLGDEQKLPLDVGRRQHASLVQQLPVEEATLGCKVQNAPHVVGIAPKQAVGLVLVEGIVGTHVVALALVDGGNGIEHHDKGTLALALHDATHAAVAYKIRVDGKIVQSPFSDSCHSSIVFEN